MTGADSSQEISRALIRAVQDITAPEEGQLVSWTIPWKRQPLVSFLRQAEGVPRVYWRTAADPIGFAGSGAAAVLTASGPGRFQSIARKASRLFENRAEIGEAPPAGVVPRLFGGFAFEDDPELRSFWSAFSAASFILPRYQLTRLGSSGWLTVNHLLRPDDQIEDLEYLFVEVVQQLEAAAPQIASADADPEAADAAMALEELVDRSSWEGLFEHAIGGIRGGELRKVVIARARHLAGSRPFDPTRALIRLEGRYPDCYRFLFEPVSGHAFFGATPELLARVSGRSLRTAALAGSIGRATDPEEDRRLGQELLDSAKDQHEHALVVEAIEQALRPLARRLQIERPPHLRRLSSIQHLESAIAGELSAPAGILPILEALHPTPAVGGLPRQQALELIRRTEPVERGWYAGPVGWIDPEGNGLFAVAIRSAVAVGREARLFAGAGLVGDSAADREWQEIDLKFNPLMEALAGERSDGLSEP